MGRGISWRRGWELIGEGDERFGVKDLDSGRSFGRCLVMKDLDILALGCSRI